MKLQRSRIAKWFPISLAFTGALVFFAGIFIAAFSVTAPATAQQRARLIQHSAVYVGENTCYTCHSDETADWSATLYAQTIVNPVTTPKTVLANLDDGHETLQLHPADLADAYTTSTPRALVDNRDNPYYVIRTEEGQTVYPGPWDAAQTAPETGHDDDSPFFCSACHLTEFVPEILSIKADPPPIDTRPGAALRRFLDSNPTEYAIVEGHSM